MIKQTFLFIFVTFLILSCLNDSSEIDNSEDGELAQLSLGQNDIIRLEKGKNLFESMCSTCHYENKEENIGPGLGGLTNEMDCQWIIDFSISPRTVFKKGDGRALEIDKKYRARAIPRMLDQPLSKDDVQNIFYYIDSFNNQVPKWDCN